MSSSSFCAALALLVSLSGTAYGDPFFFSTGNPDGRMATASQPAGPGTKIEIESADDFFLPSETILNSATFTGLLTGGATVANVGEVRVEIYRIFPLDSDTIRTPNVPTRTNSPSDFELDDRDTASGNLTFATALLSTTPTAQNSVLNGIHPSPGQTTGGEGTISGQEVLFSINFTTPFDLPAGHYFFVPQVQITTSLGEFFWLSAPKPIVSPGTAFPPGVTDLQEWIRNENLAPDWLRVGTDIVGGSPAPQFNAAFSLNGVTVPEPASLTLLGTALLGLGFLRRRVRPRL